ncbi:hypothetical protein [Stakelama pacifica]|uniref:Outer membrane surface antigen n=1 Tax=Stakelama pacifica TaxID=517720 RepID=A0A4R6FBR0_9SPHN|nr:hypothetical protein [Stakelama pacifica]TDN78576.1 hypothetical protein EV664_11619 [Stakelama pacifica]GGO99308.1 hypothetical protein GCM10011329_32500 [Stakelama pacifica]
MNYRIAVGLPFLALLSACGGSGEVSSGNAEAPNQSAVLLNATSDPRNEAERSDAAEDAGSAGTAPRLSEIALKKGVYAQVERADGTPQCPPALAVVAVFDGKGFDSRNSADCTFVPLSREDSIWSGTQTCTDPASRSQQMEQWTVKVDSATRYTRIGSTGRIHYALCPDEKLSDWNS